MKTEPAPPTLDGVAAGAALSMGRTVPCGPPVGDATIRPEPWEYAPVVEVPPASALPEARLPRRAFPVGLLVFVVGAAAFLGVLIVRYGSASHAAIVSGNPSASAVHAQTAANHVFVDVDAIVVRPRSSSEERGAALPRGDRPQTSVAPAGATGVAPAGAASVVLRHADRPEPSASTLSERAAPRRSHLRRRVRRGRRARAIDTAPARETRSRAVPRITSELDAGDVAAVLGRQRLRLERCYERALTRAGGGTTEALHLTVHIAPDGSVGAAHAEGARLPTLGRCLEGIALGWSFPASRSGAEVPIPLRFTPRD